MSEIIPNRPGNPGEPPGDLQQRSVAMLTVKEVAERLRVSRTCVYQLVERGWLACHRIGLGRGAIRIGMDDLVAYIEACRVTGATGTIAFPRSVRLKHLKQ